MWLSALPSFERGHQYSPLLGFHERDYTDVGRPNRERYPITNIDRRSVSSKMLSTRLSTVERRLHTKPSLSASGRLRKYSDRFPLVIQGYTRDIG